MRKIFHSSAKLIANDSDIDKAFESIHENDKTEIKKNNSKDWIFETIVEHGLIFYSLFYDFLALL